MALDFDYTPGPSMGSAATMGLIVLQTDETLENDFRRLFRQTDVALYHSRIANADEVTRETLGAMQADMTASAAMFPRAVEFDVVGYGCTSASSVIGTDKVAELVGAGCKTDHVTDPVSGLVAACKHLGVSRLAFLSPYVEAVSQTLRGAVRDKGVESPTFGSFNEGRDPMVARIDGPSIIAAATTLAGEGDVDALFMSCTNLRTLDVIAPIEAEIDMPVLSSNLVMAWHMAQLAGIPLHNPSVARLLA